MISGRHLSGSMRFANAVDQDLFVGMRTNDPYLERQEQCEALSGPSAERVRTLKHSFELHRARRQTALRTDKVRRRSRSDRLFSSLSLSCRYPMAHLVGWHRIRPSEACEAIDRAPPSQPREDSERIPPPAGGFAQYGIWLQGLACSSSPATKRKT